MQHGQSKNTEAVTIPREQKPELPLDIVRDRIAAARLLRESLCEPTQGIAIAEARQVLGSDDADWLLRSFVGVYNKEDQQMDGQSPQRTLGVALMAERAAMRPDHEIALDVLRAIGKPARARLIAAGVDADWATNKYAKPSDRLLRALAECVRLGRVRTIGEKKLKYEIIS